MAAVVAAVAAAREAMMAAMVQLQRFLGLEMFMVCRMWCCFFFSVVFLRFLAGLVT